MTAFEPLRTSVKIEPKALSIESVKTYVPLTIATPSTIAIAVSAARSFRPASPLSATRINARSTVADRLDDLVFADLARGRGR